MNAVWAKVYAADNDITPWGIDEFAKTLMELVLYRYLEMTPSPRPDDLVLVDALSVFMKPNSKWYETAVRHLSVSCALAMAAGRFWRISGCRTMGR